MKTATSTAKLLILSCLTVAMAAAGCRSAPVGPTNAGKQIRNPGWAGLEVAGGAGEAGVLLLPLVGILAIGWHLSGPHYERPNTHPQRNLDGKMVSNDEYCLGDSYRAPRRATKHRSRFRSR